MHGEALRHMFITYICAKNVYEEVERGLVLFYDTGMACVTMFRDASQSLGPSLVDTNPTLATYRGESRSWSTSSSAERTCL